MTGKRATELSLKLGAAAVAGYAAYAGAIWLRYGRTRDRAAEADPLLDRFLPDYEVVERHRVFVDAPADMTLAAACEADLLQSGIVRGIFRIREAMLGSKRGGTPRRALVDMLRAVGWGTLAEAPGREIVFGAVTQPWAADVVFHALPPGQFMPFHEPGYVKIAFTLRADPMDSGGSVFRTETRAISTDARARSKFRLYWALVSPGVRLIRRVSLGIVRAEAERRARGILGLAGASNAMEVGDGGPPKGGRKC